MDTFILFGKVVQLAAKKSKIPVPFMGKGFRLRVEGRWLARNRATARER